MGVLLSGCRSAVVVVSEVASSWLSPQLGQTRHDAWHAPHSAADGTVAAVGGFSAHADSRVESDLELVRAELTRARQRLAELKAELRTLLHREVVSHQERMRDLELRHAEEVAAARESARRWARSIVDEARASIATESGQRDDQ
jgi:hypothetical protein